MLVAINTETSIIEIFMSLVLHIYGFYVMSFYTLHEE